MMRFCQLNNSLQWLRKMVVQSHLLAWLGHLLHFQTWTLHYSYPQLFFQTHSDASIRSVSSLVSQTSGISHVRTEDDKCRANFDEWYKTATSTEEEVLRKFHAFFGFFELFLNNLKRDRWQCGLQMYTNISTCHLPLVWRKESLYTHILACHEFYSFNTCLIINKLTLSSHPSITISRAWHDESTGNLKCHVTNCGPVD